ncbi:hypothetical protein D0Y65_010907 [Glycine soja]|uniref:Uncharacterized protein n=1 Tax=Glycine soja TaxID=3848 RepID=A0A445KI14_GLYSO|nr:hypothetical protein D0Y65_010907 [Glycine soja]
MWKWLFCREPAPPPLPPTVVLVPPLFDFPPLAARNRMLHPIYDVVFGKLAITSLFQDYFHQARHLTTRIMLKPIDNPHVDVIATVLLITSRKKVLPEMRCFAGKVMLMILTRLWTFMYPRPIQGNAKLTNLMNWSCAMGYGVGSGSPLCPSFNFNLEIVKSSQAFYCLVLSTYGCSKTGDSEREHEATNRTAQQSPARPAAVSSAYDAREDDAHSRAIATVKNPLEENSVVGITNYIDFGFELQTWYSFCL